MMPAITGAVEASGYRVTSSRRHARYYRHRPGWPSRLLSRRGTLPLARQPFAAFNRLFGSRGNN
jgi:hypothetical protein